MLKEMGHPFARGEKVYDVTFENVQAGLRTDYLFRLANQRGGIVLGTGDLSELALGWSHLRRRRPDVALQRQRRRAQDADPAPDPLGHRLGSVRRRTWTTVLQSVLDTEITPELVPTGEDEEMQSSEAKVGPVCAAGLLAVPGAALRVPAVEDRVPGLACVERRRARRLAAGLPGDKRPAYSLKEIRHWLQVFVQRFYSFSQFKRSALPNGPKVSARRLAVAARRLAGAVGHVGADLAGRDRARGPRRLGQPSRARRRSLRHPVRNRRARHECRQRAGAHARCTASSRCAGLVWGQCVARTPANTSPAPVVSTAATAAADTSNSPSAPA